MIYDTISFLDHFQIIPKNYKESYLEEHNLSSPLSDDEYDLLIDDLLTPAVVLDIPKTDILELREDEYYMRVKIPKGIFHVVKKAMLGDANFLQFMEDDIINSFFNNYNFSMMVGRMVSVEALDHQFDVNKSDLTDVETMYCTLIEYLGQILGHTENYLVLRSITATSFVMKTEMGQGIDKKSHNLMFVAKALITRIDTMHYGSLNFIIDDDNVTNRDIDIELELIELGLV